MVWRTTAAILVLIGLVNFILIGGEHPAKPATVAPLCANSVADAEEAKQIVQQGLKQGLDQHTQHLYTTWLRNDVEASQHAAAGVYNELRAYFHAKEMVNALKIPLCK